MPTLLLIGASAAFVARCRGIAAAHRVFVRTADVPTAATAATQARPRTILMTHAVYARDPLELDAIGRDIQAKLVRVEDEAVDEEDLDRTIADVS